MKQLTFVDTHCHLNSKQFDEDLHKVVTSSKKAGVKKMIVPGFDIHTSIKSIAIAEKYKDACFATVGIHPYHAAKIHDLLQTRKEMIDLIKNHKITAIGEVGLDYHIYKGEQAQGKKAHQKDLLRIEIEIALQYDLPVILHCRDAWEDYIDLLKEYKNQNLRAVSHCFAGGLLHLREVSALGLYVGFDGNITYDSRLPDIVKHAPLDRILIETDSPFLAPIPFRGSKNIPKNIRFIAQFIASLKNESLKAVASTTSQNAFSLFKLN